MDPKVAELVAALPEELQEQASKERELQDLLSLLAHKPVPTSRVLRMWCLGTLQAKIAAAYLVNWIRGGFAGAEEKTRLRNEAHLKAAVQLLGSMGYLRGAIMKLGQTLACYPQIVPEAFVETLSALHFEAPPMHYSLLREHLRKELGGDPEELFASFDEEAFAAASLGQVHRAVLHSGEKVAVKVQYPNIARTIRADLANVRALLQPMRLTRDWDNLIENLAEIESVLLSETDYRHELENAKKVRALLAELDDVVVPRMFPEHSSARVLTMEYVAGQHLPEFMSANPSQDLRDHHGAQIMRTCARLFHSGRLFAADPNPGNFFFMPDGKLGLVDFGCVREFTEDEWDYFKQSAEAMRTGGEALRAIIQRGSLLSDEEMEDEERYRLTVSSCDWYWEPLQEDEPYDFGRDDYMQRGLEIMSELVRKRYTRTMPIFNWMNRTFIGVRALCYSLRARVNLRRIDDEEMVRAAE